MNSKTGMNKAYRVIWTYGTREYDYMEEMVGNEEFGFMMGENVYITVEDCRLSITTRNRRWGMFIYTRTHADAVATAEFIAQRSPRCTEVCIAVTHEDVINPAAFVEVALDQQQQK